MSGEELLATNVVAYACYDYVAACTKLELSKKGVKKYKEDRLEYYKNLKKDCLSFFNGELIKIYMHDLCIPNLMTLLNDKVNDAVSIYLKKHTKARKKHVV